MVPRVPAVVRQVFMNARPPFRNQKSNGPAALSVVVNRNDMVLSIQQTLNLAPKSYSRESAPSCAKREMPDFYFLS